MTIDEKLRDEKLRYSINIKAAKTSAYHQVKLINMIILQMRKYYFPSKSNKTTSYIHHLEKHLKKEAKN